MTLCIVYAITAVTGRGSIWQQSMFETLNIPHYSVIPDYFYNLPFNEWWIIYGGIVLVYNTIERYAVLRLGG